MARTAQPNGTHMATSTLGTRPTPQTAPIECDATTDALVADLRAVAADLRGGKNDLRKERGRLTQAATTEKGAPAPETRRDWLARGLKFWCL